MTEGSTSLDRARASAARRERGVPTSPALYLALVDHDRNRNWSAEEIDVIDRIVTRLAESRRRLDRPCSRRRDGSESGGYPRRRALQRAGESAGGASSVAAGAGRDRGQVPGTGGAGRDLLDGDVAAGGCAARDGVPVQPESPQRCDLAGAVRGRFWSRRRRCSSRSAGRRGRCSSRTRCAVIASWPRWSAPTDCVTGPVPR